MTPEQIYESWAPPGGRWSPWAKPVVFAHLHLLQESLDQPWAGESPGLPGALPPVEADGATAIVVDIPGADSVELGLALASRGFFPVPLYNAVPVPVLAMGGRTVGPIAVDLTGIARAIEEGAEVMTVTTLPWDAPPAFLLDARRRGEGAAFARLQPGAFDNRSVSLPTDFPSANFLLASGIRRVMVIVPATQSEPQMDLCHTLRRWQEAGVVIELFRLGADTQPNPVAVPRPRWYRQVWYALRLRLGLRRHLLGGYGGFIPIPSEGGSGIG